MRSKVDKWNWTEENEAEENKSRHSSRWNIWPEKVYNQNYSFYPKQNFVIDEKRTGPLQVAHWISQMRWMLGKTCTEGENEIGGRDANVNDVSGKQFSWWIFEGGYEKRNRKYVKKAWWKINKR